MIYDNKNHQHLMKDVAGAKIIQGTQSDKSGHNTKLKATIFTEQSVPTSPVL